jgi:hypothetical protein
MKSLRNPAFSAQPGRRTPPAAVLIFLLALVSLAASLAETPTPAAPAREVNAVDLIAAELPNKKTVKSATQIEFLSAVCAVVRRRHSSAAVITQTAVTLRREFAGEIVGMVLRCLGKVDCETAGAIVAAAKAAEGDTAKITDAAMAKLPDCAETIREAARRGGKNGERAEPAAVVPAQAPRVGTSNATDESFDPREPLTLVCVDGLPRAIRASLLDEFLRANPGAVVGRCPPAVSPSPDPPAVP